MRISLPTEHVTREELNAAMQRFLQRGGKIKKMPPAPERLNTEDEFEMDEVGYLCEWVKRSQAEAA